MGDLYVHVRMKACCRKTLQDLDERKKKARFEDGLLGLGSLFEALGELTIDAAYVHGRLDEIVKDEDLSRYIL